MQEAFAAYEARGGSKHGLARAAGLSTAAIYRALAGKSLGRITAGKLAPHLGVDAAWLMGIAEKLGPTEVKAKEEWILPWLREIPERLWPKIRDFGNALAAADIARSARTTRIPDTKSKRPRRPRAARTPVTGKG